MVVDFIDIGIGWWRIRPYILMQKTQKTNTPFGVFFTEYNNC